MIIGGFQNNTLKDILLFTYFDIMYFFYKRINVLIYKKMRKTRSRLVDSEADEYLREVMGVVDDTVCTLFIKRDPHGKIV